MNQIGKGRIGHAFPAEGDDKHTAAEGVDIRGRLAKPGDELPVDLFLSQESLHIAQEFVINVWDIGEMAYFFIVYKKLIGLSITA